MSPGRRSRPADHRPADFVKADNVTIAPSVNKSDDIETWEHPKHGLIYGLPIRGATVWAVALELPDRFVRVDRATDEHFQEAAELAGRRLGRCKIGTRNWWWYQAVIAEHERRRRARFGVLSGGAS